MSKIFNLRPVVNEEEPAVMSDGLRGFREVLRLVEAGGPLEDFGAPVAWPRGTEGPLRRIIARYGFDRLPLTYSELYGLFEYCDSLEAASGTGMMPPEQFAEWQQASFEVWRRKRPDLMPAIERFCAGDVEGLTELHRQEDTLPRIGVRYLEEN